MSLKGTVWAPIGPSPMNEGGGNDNGLVTTIAVNPDNNNIIYLGSAQGGVWRSGDAGATWTPLFDKQASLGIGEPGGIAIDPNDTSTIFVGTSGRVGSAEPDTVSQPTAGLFKSRDGGASWGCGGLGLPGRQHRQRCSVQEPDDQHHPRRSRQQPRRLCKYPPAKPGALGCEPLKAVGRVADAAREIGAA